MVAIAQTDAQKTGDPIFLSKNYRYRTTDDFLSKDCLL